MLGKKGKIAVDDNCCYGEWRLSSAAVEALGVGDEYSIDRTDPRLVALIKEKGSQWCSGPRSQLEIFEVPVAPHWDVDDYEGIESVSW